MPASSFASSFGGSAPRTTIVSRLATGGARARFPSWHAIWAWRCQREFVTTDDVDGIIVRTDQVGASTAAEACFEARGLGTSYPPSRILATLVAGTRWKLINMRKSAIFGLADSVPATKALPVALASHLVFADQTPRAVEARVAAWGAEGVVLVLDRHLELRAAAGIATIVTRLCDTHADAYRDRKPDRLCRRPGELVCVSERR